VGYETPCFEALCARSCQVLNLDQNGHDNLSKTAKCIVEISNRGGYHRSGMFVGMIVV
jgi:hypothetical protein